MMNKKLTIALVALYALALTTASIGGGKMIAKSKGFQVLQALGQAGQDQEIRTSTLTGALDGSSQLANGNLLSAELKEKADTSTNKQTDIMAEPVRPPADKTASQVTTETRAKTDPSIQNTEAASSPEQVVNSSTTETPAPMTQMISLDNAIDIALAKTGGGRVIEAELEEDDGKIEYEIEIIKDAIKYEVEIDAYTGAIVDYEEKPYHQEAENKTDDNNQASAETSKPPTTETTIQVNNDQALQTNMISLERAVEIALAKTDGGYIVEIELEVQGNKAEYEIEIIKGDKKCEVELNAYTGALIDYEEEALKANKDYGQAIEQGSYRNLISLQQATDIALAKTNGGTVSKIELEIKSYKAEYEIKITNGNKKYEVEIDAQTGNIIDFELDD